MVRFFLRCIVGWMELICGVLDISEYAPIYFKISVKITGFHCCLAQWAFDIDEKYNLKTWEKLIPNETTLKAIHEVEQGTDLQGYSDLDEMFQELGLSQFTK